MVNAICVECARRARWVATRGDCKLYACNYHVKWLQMDLEFVSSRGWEYTKLNESSHNTRPGSLSEKM